MLAMYKSNCVVWAEITQNISTWCHGGTSRISCLQLSPKIVFGSTLWLQLYIANLSASRWFIWCFLSAIGNVGPNQPMTANHQPTHQITYYYVFIIIHLFNATMQIIIMTLGEPGLETSHIVTIPDCDIVWHSYKSIIIDSCYDLTWMIVSRDCQKTIIRLWSCWTARHECDRNEKAF